MFKNLVCLFFTLGLLIGCELEPKEEVSSINPENWSKRQITINTKDSLEYGKSYLSIYSQIYSLSEHKTHNLTAMVSMRNTSDQDSIYLLSAEYYDTHGKKCELISTIRFTWLPWRQPEIIIDEIDVEGGTGSNFLFEWKIPKNAPEPLFEGVMNSTVGQQGLSFTTQSRRIR